MGETGSGWLGKGKGEINYTGEEQVRRAAPFYWRYKIKSCQLLFLLDSFLSTTDSLLLLFLFYLDISTLLLVFTLHLPAIYVFNYSFQFFYYFCPKHTFLAFLYFLIRWSIHHPSEGGECFRGRWGEGGEGVLALIGFLLWSSGRNHFPGVSGHCSELGVWGWHSAGWEDLHRISITVSGWSSRGRRELELSASWSSHGTQETGFTDCWPSRGVWEAALAKLEGWRLGSQSAGEGGIKLLLDTAVSLRDGKKRFLER